MPSHWLARCALKLRRPEQRGRFGHGIACHRNVRPEDYLARKRARFVEKYGEEALETLSSWLLRRNMPLKTPLFREETRPDTGALDVVDADEEPAEPAFAGTDSWETQPRDGHGKWTSDGGSLDWLQKRSGGRPLYAQNGPNESEGVAQTPAPVGPSNSRGWHPPLQTGENESAEDNPAPLRPSNEEDAQGMTDDQLESEQKRLAKDPSPESKERQKAMTEELRKRNCMYLQQALDGSNETMGILQQVLDGKLTWHEARRRGVVQTGSAGYGVIGKGKEMPRIVRDAINEVEHDPMLNGAQAGHAAGNLLNNFSDPQEFERQQARDEIERQKALNKVLLRKLRGNSCRQ